MPSVQCYPEISIGTSRRKLTKVFLWMDVPDSIKLCELYVQDFNYIEHRCPGRKGGEDGPFLLAGGLRRQMVIHYVMHEREK